MHTSPTEQFITWQENGQDCALAWNCLTSGKAPSRVQIVDDTTTADQAYRLACEGIGLLWRGDYQNGRQLLQAMARRADPQKTDKRAEKKAAKKPAPSMLERFHQYRMSQAQRARILGMLLLEFDANFVLNLRRAPEVAEACRAAYGNLDHACITPMRELLGVIGAHEWRRNGVEIAALGDKIHPHYGVYSPVRGEYIELIAQAELPKTCKTAFDIGTGTGVLAALLAKRGVAQITAADNSSRALVCAQDNVQRLQLGKQIQVQAADLFPAGSADLLVCNPPWLPGKASSMLEHAIYDQDSRMLRGFLQGAAAHLNAKGQVWLVMSDLAELLGLRTREQLLQWIQEAGLQLLGKDDTQPTHSKAKDETDPLHQARSKETTSLWRLVKAK